MVGVGKRGGASWEMEVDLIRVDHSQVHSQPLPRLFPSEDVVSTALVSGLFGDKTDSLG